MSWENSRKLGMCGGGWIQEQGKRFVWALRGRVTGRDLNEPVTSRVLGVLTTALFRIRADGGETLKGVG